MKFELLRKNLQAVKEGMGMKENIALDRGVHCQTLKDVMRDISTGRPERALMITSMEGATLCFNLDHFLLYSPLLRSIVATSYLISSPIHMIMPNSSLSALMALESLLSKGVSKAGEVGVVLSAAEQMGINIKALAQIDRDSNKTTNRDTNVNATSEAGMSGCAPQPPEMLKETNHMSTTPITSGSLSGNVVEMNKPPNDYAKTTEAAPPPLTGVSAGVVSVQVFGEEEDEDEAEKEEGSGTLEIKSEPEEPAVEKSSDHITATAALVNSSSSEKRKTPASEGVDEVHLKKKKLLDVVLKNMMDKKAGVVEGSKEVNKSAISDPAKKSKSKQRTSDISNIAAKTIKEDVAAAAGETAGQGRRKSISSTGELAMNRVMNGAGQKAKNTESVKKVKNATKQMLVKPSDSSTLVLDDEGKAGVEASKKKFEVQSISKSPKAVKIKPQIASPKAQKKILKKAQAADPKVLKSKEGATPSGNSLKDANQANDDALTISTLPQAVNLHSKTNEVSENSTICPEASAGNPPAAPAIADVERTCPGESSAVVVNQISKQVEAVERGDDGGKPQKAARVEVEEKGGDKINYTTTCELCQKENKTLQALYSHVIVHIRVELERKVKDLMDMEGLQCKMCDQSFKGKASLLNHIGCKHGKVNDILKEKGYSVLPCLLATNGNSGAEMQANLVRIKKERGNVDTNE